MGKVWNANPTVSLMTRLFITSLTLQNSGMPPNGTDPDNLSLDRHFQRTPCLQNMDRDWRL